MDEIMCYIFGTLRNTDKQLNAARYVLKTHSTKLRLLWFASAGLLCATTQQSKRITKLNKRIDELETRMEELQSAKGD